MKTYALLLCALAAPAGAAPSGMPPEVRPLLDILEEPRLVESRVRAFHKLRQEMYFWAFEHAKELQALGDQELAEWRLEAGERHLELIEAAYVVALDRYPDNAKLMNGYGEYLYDLAREYPEAVMSWQHATALDSDYAPPYLNLGIHYWEQGESEFALDAFGRALDLAPDTPGILYTVAQFYLKQPGAVARRYEWKPPKVYKEAMKLSRKAADLAPSDYEFAADYAVNFYGAEQFGAEANWSEAAKAWQRARAAANSEQERFFTWVNEGRVCNRAGRRDRALECLEEARALIPGHESINELARELSAAP